MSVFGLLLRTGNEMMCCKEIHPLLLECLITFLRYRSMIGRASEGIYNACHGQHLVNPTTNNSQFLCKIAAFGHPFHTRNGMLCCKDLHILLLECLITILTYRTMFGRAFDSIHKSGMVNTVSLLPNITLKFHVKCQFLGSCSAQEMR